MEQFHLDVLEVIRKTREISLPQFGSAKPQEKKSHKAYDVVTEVDKDIENFLGTEFRRLDPSIDFVGEEFGGDRDSKKFWLVDPVDGTGLYIRGLPGCTTMVSLIDDGEVVFGAIYDFASDSLYYAAKGGGAFMNDTAIKVSERGFNNAYIGYESNIGKEENLQKYFDVKELCAPLKYMSSGFEYAYVASGKIDGRITLEPYGVDYDFAPGCLLVKEAGGVVTNIGSGAYDYRNLNHIAANPVLHRQLTEGPDALFPLAK